MLTDKHKKELGAYIFGILNIPANKEAEMIKLGTAVEQYVRHLDYISRKEKAESK